MRSSDTPAPDTLALTYGSLLARIWLGVRALQTGIEKFAGTKVSEEVVTINGAPSTHGLTEADPEKFYAISNYHGIPDALAKQFAGEPLIPGFFMTIYGMILGPALLVLGLTILLGIASRTSLFALGLLYISLTWGLILMGQAGAAGVAWLGVHMILIVIALYLAPYNRFCLLKKW